MYYGGLSSQELSRVVKSVMWSMWRFARDGALANRSTPQSQKAVARASTKRPIPDATLSTERDRALRISTSRAVNLPPPAQKYIHLLLARRQSQLCSQGCENATVYFHIARSQRALSRSPPCRLFRCSASRFSTTLRPSQHPTNLKSHSNALSNSAKVRTSVCRDIYTFLWFTD